MADTNDLVAGALVTPAIRLVRQLGQGGMGSVWVAEHLRLRTQVVVKFIAREFAEHQEALQRFEREASLAAQAKSPHVVQVFDHGVSTFGLPYIAMELLEGEDLGSRIERERSIAPDVFAVWLRQACAGLSRAHGKGIVHRDVKPENIFLCNEEGDVLVKVLDFGIAKSDSAAGAFTATRTGAVMGTAFYMSPEQMMGAKELDYRADLWALGVVTFYALTGVRPFDGTSMGSLVYAITHGPIPVPSAHNPSLSPAIDAWMVRALARAPDERFASAKEMAEQFLEAAGVQSVAGRTRMSTAPRGTAPSHPSSGTIPPWGQTNPGTTKRPPTKLLTVAGLLALALAGAAAIFFVRSGDNAPPSIEVMGANASAAQPSGVPLPDVSSATPAASVEAAPAPPPAAAPPAATANTAPKSTPAAPRSASAPPKKAAPSSPSASATPAAPPPPAQPSPPPASTASRKPDLRSLVNDRR